ncbi:MAG TPA: hypothetical protein VEG30_00360 [Terriglobales bacterium]|nr:hypothetical protein [Terriglobales bacterium]
MVETRRSLPRSAGGSHPGPVTRYRSFATLTDPDGNGWLITARRDLAYALMEHWAW